MSIPEQTILQNGHVVDNIQFVNKHRLGGLHLYDPQKPEEKLDLAGINVPKTPLLNNFLANPEHLMFFYDDKTQFLSVKGNMSYAAYEALLKVYGNQPVNLEKVNLLFAQSNALQKFYKTQTYTAKEQDFLKKNALEYNLKVKAGWFFFHHSWVLNPMLALSLGADAKHQVFLYGWGSTLFLKQALSLLGGMSFQNYFKSIFIFYPLYFFIFLAALYGIFRRIDFVCIGALLLSASVLVLHHQVILLAPGYNPMRHFFDMMIILLFYLYLKNNKIIYLLTSVLLGYISIIWSKDFGLFLFLSLSGTSILKLISIEKFAWKKLIFWTVAITMGLGLYALPYHGENHNLLYMLLGYTIPGTSTFMVGFILGILSFIYLLYLKYKNTASAYYWLSLCVFFYVQLQLIYYIWNPSYHHLLVSTSAVVTLGLTWGMLLGNKKHSKPSIGLISCILLFGIYLATLLGFYLNKLNYEKNFSTHVVHNWEFEYGRFQTTMEPQVFEETIHLIHRYESHPSMYLISKYDSILPVLAHRYQALPVINLALDLISKYDIKRCIEQINKAQPQYIFVDKDILRNLRSEIPEKHGDPQLGDPKEAYGRVSAYLNMKELFLLIQDNYQPIQKGGLLTVYQRKPGV
ncbi:MAG: hypothetical protein NXI01_04045 [Gammaproteobacteria bacterium]|nr:hypothetical protein [Gammaproteobacteria bacterium]